MSTWKKLMSNQRIVGLAAIVLLCFFLGLHLFYLTSIIPYTSLWGNPVTNTYSLRMAVVIAAIFLALFILSLIQLWRGDTLAFRKKHRGFQRKFLLSFYTAISWFATVCMVLNAIAYLRASGMALQYLMFLYCLFTACVMAWFILLTSIVTENRRRREARLRQQRRHRPKGASLS